MRHSFLAALLLAALALPAASFRNGGTIETWTQASLQDFATGRFGDAGANTYVSAAGRIQLVNRWDLNNDGCIDLVLCNTHPHVEKLDAAIYWGNGKDFDDTRKTYLLRG